MKIKIVGYGFVIVLSILLLMQLLITMKSKSHSTSEEISVQDILRYDSLECGKFQNVIYDDEDVLVNCRNDSLAFRNIISDSLLVVRFSTYSCKSCIEHLLTSVVKYSKINTNLKYTMLIANIPVGDLHIIDNNYVNFELYKVDSFSLDIDQALTPYIFCINKDRKIINYFIPRIECKEKTEEYFSSLTANNIESKY